MNQRLKVGIIGVGMVGTPLRRYFEEVQGYRRGEELFLFDTNPEKKCADEVNCADVIFVCVPTPRAPTGSASLEAVKSAFVGIADGKIVVLKSTV
ncbi:MAG: hypothetical protein U1A26_01875, partial [Candidatus Sungbacteria bacterium]|nr:hypothetical protein [Candidatus Sungbacteria bacterium]